MKFIAIFVLTLALVSCCSAAKKKKSKQPVAAAASEPVVAATAPEQPRKPKINWGKCPQLEPTEKDIEAKSNILQTCLQQNPPPTKAVTEQEIIEHQRNVTECALKIEKWFDSKGNYKFSKAEKEIKNKRLSSDMEKALVESHKTCEEISKERATQDKNIGTVEQVQIYQGCMDAHITQNCQIQIGA